MPQTSPAKAVHLLHNALVKDIGCPTISHERAYEKNAMSFQACKQTIKRTPSIIHSMCFWRVHWTHLPANPHNVL